MIIKCPECSTGYNIPDNALGDKPKKMKCAKCKHLFTVTRRTDHPPKGYVEFTGAQKLPPEFAFLQASVPAPAPAPFQDSSIPAPPVAAAAAPPPPPPRGAAAAAAPPPVPGQTSPAQTPQPQPAQAPPPQPAPAPASEQEQVHSVSDGPQAQQAANELRHGGGTPVGNSLPAESMFGGNSSAWEVEAPMELGSYAVPDEPVHHGHQAMGKIMFGVFALVVVFFVFVAFRNGWSLSFSELPEQVAFAFSSEAADEIPEAAEKIDVNVVTKKVVTSSHGIYLSVSGEVINNNPGSRHQVIIRGRLYDAKGDIRGEARMPCGRAVDDNAIQKTALGGIQQHFSDNGVIHDCQLGPNDSKLFQVIFEDLPEDYDAGFEVKVKAVAAVAK